MPEENQTNNEQTQEQQTVDTSNISVKENAGGGLTAEVTPMDDPMEDTETPEETQENETQDNSAAEQTKSIEAEVAEQQKAEEDLKNDLKSKGVDFNSLAEEYNNSGELSEESLKALEKAGYPKTVVDVYLKGLQATTERFVSQVKSFAGGEDGYTQLISFLRSQPQTKVDAFNAAIKTGNLGQIQLAINGIKAEMTTKYGTANPTVMGNGSANNNPTGYTSMNEMTKDMADPRYQVDPKFTREVMRKIKNATIF